MLRSMQGGRMKTQVIDGQEYPPFLLERTPSGAYAVKPEFKGLHDEAFLLDVLLAGVPDRQKDLFFAVGLEHGNSTIGSTALDVLMVREHNRIAGLLAREYEQGKEQPAWNRGMSPGGPGRAALPDHPDDHDRPAAEAGRRGLHPAHRAARPAAAGAAGRRPREEVEPVELDRRRVQPALPLAHARPRHGHHRGRRRRREGLPARQQRPGAREGHRVGDGAVLAVPRRADRPVQHPGVPHRPAVAGPPGGRGAVDRADAVRPAGVLQRLPHAVRAGAQAGLRRPHQRSARPAAPRRSSTGTSTTWSGTSASGPRRARRTR